MPPPLAFQPAHEDVFQFHIFVDAVMRSLAAETGLLHPAERRDLRRDQPLIHPDDATVERLRHAPGAGVALREEISGETVRRVVGEANSLIIVAKAEERR